MKLLREEIVQYYSVPAIWKEEKDLRAEFEKVVQNWEKKDIQVAANHLDEFYKVDIKRWGHQKAMDAVVEALMTLKDDLKAKGPLCPKFVENLQGNWRASGDLYEVLFRGIEAELKRIGSRRQQEPVFVSKFLHFCWPQSFFIYDELAAIAWNAIKEKTKDQELILPTRPTKSIHYQAIFTFYKKLLAHVIPNDISDLEGFLGDAMGITAGVTTILDKHCWIFGGYLKAAVNLANKGKLLQDELNEYLFRIYYRVFE